MTANDDDFVEIWARERIDSKPATDGPLILGTVSAHEPDASAAEGKPDGVGAPVTIKVNIHDDADPAAAAGLTSSTWRDALVGSVLFDTGDPSSLAIVGTPSGSSSSFTLGRAETFTRGGLASRFIWPDAAAPEARAHRFKLWDGDKFADAPSVESPNHVLESITDGVPRNHKVKRADLVDCILDMQRFVSTVVSQWPEGQVYIDEFSFTIEVSTGNAVNWVLGAKGGAEIKLKVERGGTKSRQSASASPASKAPLGKAQGGG